MLQFKTTGEKQFAISYPCVILNVMVAKNNTNDQYQDLVDTAAKTYQTSSQMSIMFEVDGPYKVSLTLAKRQRTDSFSLKHHSHIPATLACFPKSTEMEAIVIGYFGPC